MLLELEMFQSYNSLYLHFFRCMYVTIEAFLYINECTKIILNLFISYESIAALMHAYFVLT